MNSTGRPTGKQTKMRPERETVTLVGIGPSKVATASIAPAGRSAAGRPRESRHQGGSGQVRAPASRARRRLHGMVFKVG
ncbi:MAG: hypothetical protein WKF75_16160 [Singulisphaera sp.]